MSEAAVTLEGVGLVLANTVILDNISFTINTGQVHCIIGPNGGGKTSLVRCILGQMPHSGNIRIKQDKSAVRGYVPQQLEFEKTLPVTVSDFMAMVCQNRRPAFLGMNRTTRTTAENTLQRVGLAGKHNRKLGSLSGGERQRVLFAQALVPSPSMLILDEPMTSMDEPGAAVFEGLIRQLADDGVTVIWIAHDLEQVSRVADQVTCINQTVLFSGPTSEVLPGLDAAVIFSGQRGYYTTGKAGSG